MNYYQARQRIDANGQPMGVWHYTCKNDNRIWATGACAVDCPGHATEDDAYAHQKRYLLLHAALTAELIAYDAPLRCRVPGCRVMTTGGAVVDGNIYPLCDEHRTGDVLERLIVVGPSAASW